MSILTDPLDPSVTEALHAWRVQHSAGVGLADALRTSAKSCSRTEGQAAFEECARRAEAGEDPERLLDALSPILPPAERFVLAAGWKCGRVEAAMENVLAERELWYSARRRIRSRMIQPAAVLLVACLVGPFPAFFAGGSVEGYLAKALIPLVLAWALWSWGASIFRARTSRPSAGVSSLDRLLLSMPLIGTIEHSANLARCASLMGQMIGSGIMLSEALALCSRVVPNGLYRADLAGFSQRVRAGQPLGQIMKEGPLWPPEFVRAVEVGEKSGALEDSFLRLGRDRRERYVAGVEQLSDWTPRVLYALVAFYVICNIVILLGQIGGYYSSVR